MKAPESVVGAGIILYEIPLLPSLHLAHWRDRSETGQFRFLSSLSLMVLLEQIKWHVDHN